MPRELETTGNDGPSQNVGELEMRAKFLRDMHAKVVEAPKQKKPRGIEGVKTK